MAIGNFDQCLDVIIQYEGGYVNHPKDPGGITNLGITKKVYEAWMKRPVTDFEMRNLSVEDVAPVYRVGYWDRLKCDELHIGVDLVVFDFGVNAGVTRSTKFLQEIVGAVPDGVIGPKTLSRARDYCEKYKKENLIKLFSNKRRDYYRSLKTFPTFGKGWIRRVNEVERIATVMA
jgi:lysozyme family protein